MSSSDRWSVSVGPHGNTVRAEERTRGGYVYLVSWNGDRGVHEKTNLEFRVRDADGDLIPEAVDRAKDAAAEASNALIRGENPHDTDPDATVGRVFDLFRQVRIPDDNDLSDKHAAQLRRALECWETFLGRGFDLREIGVREWAEFRRQRASGRIDSRGNTVRNEKHRREVGPRTVQKDLKTLRQVCRFAERYRDRGDFILDADPTRGLELPSEPNPSRPVADDRQYEALMKVADRIRVGHGDKERAPLRELLVLSAHTGRRIGAIVRLRWSDWNPDDATYGTLRWRADSDKIGREWVVAVTPQVREALQAYRRARPGVGEAYIFPAPESDGHVRVDAAGDWLNAAADKADLWEDRPRPDNWGFHAFRRMWATKRKHLSAVDASYAGGWADESTMKRIYQQPDPETTEDVVLNGRDLRMDGDGDEATASGG